MNYVVLHMHRLTGDQMDFSSKEPFSVQEFDKVRREYAPTVKVVIPGFELCDTSRVLHNITTKIIDASTRHILKETLNTNINEA